LAGSVKEVIKALVAILDELPACATARLARSADLQLCWFISWFFEACFRAHELRARRHAASEIQLV
jgi:hypothetical protein